MHSALKVRAVRAEQVNPRRPVLFILSYESHVLAHETSSGLPSIIKDFVASSRRTPPYVLSLKGCVLPKQFSVTHSLRRAGICSGVD